MHTCRAGLKSVGQVSVVIDLLESNGVGVGDAAGSSAEAEDG